MQPSENTIEFKLRVSLTGFCAALLLSFLALGLTIRACFRVSFIVVGFNWQFSSVDSVTLVEELSKCEVILGY